MSHSSLGTLEDFVKERKAQKNILLCSHAVVGFPSLEANKEAIAKFCDAGVDIMELQFPFTDPVADGPILLHANQRAVENQTSVDDCFQLARDVVPQHPNTAFVIMTYYNIIYKRGLERFAEEAEAAGIRGVIIPDLPLEESKAWHQAATKRGLAPIMLVTPHSSDQRIAAISEMGRGFLYCVARKGTTGQKTKFGHEFVSYIQKVRSQSNLPLGVGFGIRTKQDVEQLKPHVDIAIVCSEAIKIQCEQGIDAAAEFLRSLR